MVEQVKQPEPKPKQMTKDDVLRMFYLILDQNKVTEDNKMSVNVKALQTIPKSKICGEIEDGVLSIWLSQTRQQKRKKERSKELMLPDRKLILPNRKDVYHGKEE